MKQIFPKEYTIALKAAVEAAKVILEIYAIPFESKIKEDGSPVTKADIASTEVIRAILEKTNIPITDEESIQVDYAIRKNWNKSWCIDPLDGTKEFIKKNGEFVINIALIENEKAIFGIIAHPISQSILFGGIDFTAKICHFDDIYEEDKWKLCPSKDQLNTPIVMMCSRSHHTGEVQQLLSQIKEDAYEVIFNQKGSALKFFDLAKGNADFYPRFAPTMEWDIAAGHAILNGLGGEIYNAETGKPLTYNKENLYNPYFIAKTKAFKEKW